MKFIAVLLLGSSAAIAWPAEARSPATAEQNVAHAAKLLMSFGVPSVPKLVGEMHGTKETPAIVAQLVDLLADNGAVLLGLETPSSEQSRVDEFLQSDGSADAQLALLGGDFWQRPVQRQDGRSSAGMFSMLKRIRVLIRTGAEIDVVCFDISSRVDDRDHAMAQTLRESIVSHPASSVVVLVGNVHAQLWKHDPTRMAWWLRDLRPLSVAVSALSGAIWACTGGNGCGRLEFDHRDGVANPAVHIEPTEVRVKGYNGVLYLPTFTAAPPAVSSITKPKAR